jgi:ABC-2 type transport system ATP-binding protein
VNFVESSTGADVVAPSVGDVIEARGLTKRYDGRSVVSDLSFRVRPGIVTGFLGANGSGKSTTLRMIVGLVRPNAGSATIGGVGYRDLPRPASQVGILLDPNAVQRFRTGIDHLTWMCRVSGTDPAVIPAKLEAVGLEGAGRQRIGEYSLGMCQRLALAGTMLADPPVVILDEPINGLDAEGIRWMRRLLRSMADEGRTVLVSSHLMDEMEKTADRVIIINQGRLVEDVTIPELTAWTAGDCVVVRSDDDTTLAGELRAVGGRVETVRGALDVRDVTTERIGQVALACRIALVELRPVRTTLEEAFLSITDEATPAKVMQS